MESMNHPQTEREVRVTQAGRRGAGRARRAGRPRGRGRRGCRGGSACSAVLAHRGDHGVSSPAFCVIAQGSKEVLLGDDVYRYDANHYLITAAALPIASRITEASEERPYLGVVLGLDPALVGSVMVEAGHPAPGERAAVTGLRREPAGRGPAGRRGAARQAPGRRPPRRRASSGRSSPGRSSSGS